MRLLPLGAALLALALHSTAATQRLVLNSTWTKLHDVVGAAAPAGAADAPAARHAHIAVGPVFGRYMLVHGGASRRGRVLRGKSCRELPFPCAPCRFLGCLG